MSKPLLIKPREYKPEEFQVRFHCDEYLYEEFKKKLEQNGIYIKDAFVQFMEWYLK